MAYIELILYFVVDNKKINYTLQYPTNSIVCRLWTINSLFSQKTVPRPQSGYSEPEISDTTKTMHNYTAIGKPEFMLNNCIKATYATYEK